MSLEVKNIVKKYGDKTVVDNLSFSMEKPGVYALLGTNGAGKTTTLRIILGMLEHDGGEVLWNGAPLDPMKVNIGYLAEERGLYPKYALIDQLVYFAGLKGIKESVAKDRIKYWSKRLEVEEYIYPKTGLAAGKKGRGVKKTKPMQADQLSKGNQQKIQLMAALLSDPELIVLDEPLSGLDPVNADLFKAVIREIIDAGKYVIMSSHQMDVIEEFCKDITILNRGIAVVQGDLNEIKKGYGRVNMMVKCEENIMELAVKNEMNVIKETPDGMNIKVVSEEQAGKFLKTLVENNMHVIKYELREPSLHEIFVEKAGGAHEE
ncbi:MAG: ATP-binding cassette domain-containing protein [Eubacteriales bacterium]|nr:ATP-binding cassette domain-containing protein [Eubacteriales bacterium]